MLALYTNCYFIYNNLKVSPFLLQDSPLPGFRVLTWEHESWTNGTLWDLGKDAGFSIIGKDKVYGQLWVAEDLNRIEDINSFFGVKSGLTIPTEIDVSILIDNLITESIPAITFALESIKPTYKIVSDGKWLIRRN